MRVTPVEHAPSLSHATGSEVYLKLENQQVTGSFKVRGALNALLSRKPDVLSRGVVAASTGNHGLATLYACERVGTTCTIFAPATGATSKLDALRRAGADVRLRGDDCVEAEVAARTFAEGQGSLYLSPYNDPDVVAGQGTIGLELAEQLAELDAVYVAVGGGGLIGGIGGYLKKRFPAIEVVGCSPENSPAMYRAIEAGGIVPVDSLATLSDGTAGGIESGAITFELCRDVIDRFVLVPEEAIRASLRSVVEQHHTLIEGAAAVPVAGLLADSERRTGRIAVVLCGANIGPDVLAGSSGERARREADRTCGDRARRRPARPASTARRGARGLRRRPLRRPACRRAAVRRPTGRDAHQVRLHPRRPVLRGQGRLGLLRQRRARPAHGQRPDGRLRP
jgi:threonine dehydratase